MGLVDYSDSESDSETPQTSTPVPPASTTCSQQPPKKSFQKLVDKTNPGKILVSLPTAASTTNSDETSSDEPAAKRVKIGGGRFSGFSSFLPAPKSNTRPATGTGGKAAPKVGINLKTSSEAAFSRDAPTMSMDEYGGGGDGDGDNRDKPGLNLPPPKTSTSNLAQPSIPEGQKTAEEVKLVGKPTMFKPLSVARNSNKKKANLGKAPVAAKPAAIPSTLPASQQPASITPSAAPQTAVPPAKKKVSLFSIADDEPIAGAATGEDESASYEPEFTSYSNTTAYSNTPIYPDPHHQQQYYNDQTATFSSYNNKDPNSLDSIADDLNLDPIARRELFGRGGSGSGSSSSNMTAKSVINFNMDEEYRHNEELRASGALDQQQHNPLRAIKPGKHSLQQLVNAVQTQRDALEENFAKNRSTQKQAGSKYGFR